VVRDEAGLRARKKHQTRQVIADRAMALFLADGFDRVTVTEVARAADVSVNTVFNYFRTKEDLFFERHYDTADALATVARTRAQGEPFVAAFRRDFLNALIRRDPSLGLGDGAAALIRLWQSSDALRARMRELLERREHLLGRAMSELTGGDWAIDVRARLAAAQLAATHRVLCAELHRRITAGAPVAEVCRTLAPEAAHAWDELATGLGEYGRYGAS
jgi:AcrR family transcriptional regulator